VNVPVGCDAKRFIKGAGINDCLPPTVGEVDVGQPQVLQNAVAKLFV